MDKDIELTKNQILWKLNDLTSNLPAISISVGDILGEAVALRDTVNRLGCNFETKEHFYKEQIKELTEKIKELEGGKDNE